MSRKMMGVNFIARFLICLSVSFLLIGYSVSAANSKTNKTMKSETSANQTKVILWDFRKGENIGPSIPKAESRLVMKYLFGDKWDQELAVTGRVSGSFTKPNAKQTLYYVGGCDEDEEFKSTSNCAHVNWWNAGWIAVYEGTTPVAKVKAALGYEILKITDVNGDGKNEILSLFSYTNQGSTESSATLGQLSGNKYEEIKTFSSYSDGCGTMSKRTQITKAAVISFVPLANGKFPPFSEEYFQSPCEGPQWKKITKKQFEN